MNDESTFLQAMQQQPEDGALRLVFADWLEERGDPRGELLRLLNALTQAVVVPQRQELENRLRSLLTSGVQPVGPYVTNSVEMKFAWIPPGTFMMGSPANEEERGHDEIQHQVTLTKGFWLGIHPVSQASWREVMGNNPSHTQGDDLPVEQVSWNDCQEFLLKLSDQDGHWYRLPTEAEWEYACRAGTTTPFHFGETISTDQVNYDGHYPHGASERGECRGRTTPAGMFPPNGWGLHDMHGNVSEYCADWYEDYPYDDVVDPQGGLRDELGRVMRGGSFLYAGFRVRSADRHPIQPSIALKDMGFRIVMMDAAESHGPENVAMSKTFRPFRGHEGRVWSVAYAPDGKTLASASDDESVRLWDAATGKELRQIQGHEGWVFCVAYAPDGKTLATASKDQTVRLWDEATGKELRQFRGHRDEVRSVAYSPDGLTLATASDDMTVRLWDVTSGRELHQFRGHRSLVFAVAYAPDGKTLASASVDKTVRLWDAVSGKELRQFQGHLDTVQSVAYSPDGTTLASASNDGTVRLWDVATGKELRQFQGHQGTVNSVVFAPDGHTLASAGVADEDKTVRLWDVATGKQLRQIQMNKAGGVIFATYAPDGKTLASANVDKTVRLWDEATGKEL